MYLNFKEVIFLWILIKMAGLNTKMYIKHQKANIERLGTGLFGWEIEFKIKCKKYKWIDIKVINTEFIK
jgi:hypothetical protein